MAGVECIVDCRCVLGEGPLWDELSGRLYWFDIKGRRLHWLATSTGRSEAVELEVQTSAACLRAAGGLLAATERGLETLDPQTGRLDLIEPKEPDLEGFRANDGKIDIFGAFWWSVMDDDGGRRPGRVYRKTPDGPSRLALDGIHIANTISCSPDGETLYLADSALQTLNAYRVGASGELGPPSVFARTSEGAPDGAAVDEDGFIWNAQWGASRIVRYAPDGRIDHIVETPVSQPSSCAFGGPERTTLYVTSARDGLDPAALEREPQAGGLFALETGVRGLKLPRYQG